MLNDSSLPAPVCPRPRVRARDPDRIVSFLHISRRGEDEDEDEEGDEEGAAGVREGVIVGGEGGE